MSAQTFKNQLLVSSPQLKGDYFEKTVVLLVEHSSDGAFGLIINKPADMQLNQLIMDLPDDSHWPILQGGPVDKNLLYFLHEGEPLFPQTIRVGEDICMTSSSAFFDLVKDGNAPRRCLAILGCSGWDGGQLEHEIAQDAWLLAPASAELVFDTPLDKRLDAAAAVIGIDLALLTPTRKN